MALAGMTADRPATFSYDPQPRWQEEPETEELCRAIESECPGQLKDGHAQVFTLITTMPNMIMPTAIWSVCGQ